MCKAINTKISSEYQLILLGIDLVHKVFSLQDCNEQLGELESNPHIVKAYESANKFNDAFVKLIVMSKGGK